MLNRLLEFFGQAGYWGPFAVLVLCGFALPIPEEITLLGSGILLHTGRFEFLPICAACIAAILLGDSVPFWLGRRYGLSALRIRWVARVLHPERFAKIERKFQEHAMLTTFTFRFFAGVRIPGYFVAGLMGMRYWRFLLLDLVGALLTVPISIYAGKLFGDQIDKLRHEIHNLHLILAFAAIALLVVVVVKSRWRSRASAQPLAVPAAAPTASHVVPAPLAEAAQALEAGVESPAEPAAAGAAELARNAAADPLLESRAPREVPAATTPRGAAPSNPES